MALKKQLGPVGEELKKKRDMETLGRQMTGLLTGTAPRFTSKQGETYSSDTSARRQGSVEKTRTQRAIDEDAARVRRGQAAADRARKVEAAAKKGAVDAAMENRITRTAGVAFPSQMGDVRTPGSEAVQRTATGPATVRSAQDAQDALKALELIKIASTRGDQGGGGVNALSGLQELGANPMQLVPILRMFTSPSASGRTEELLANESTRVPLDKYQNALIEAQRLYQDSENAPMPWQRALTYYGGQVPTFLAEGEGVAKGLGLAGRGVMAAGQRLAPGAVNAIRGALSSFAGQPVSAGTHLARDAAGRALLGAGERAFLPRVANAAEAQLERVLAHRAPELAKHEAVSMAAHSAGPHAAQVYGQRPVYGL